MVLSLRPLFDKIINNDMTPIIIESNIIQDHVSKNVPPVRGKLPALFVHVVLSPLLFLGSVMKDQDWKTLTLQLAED